ncbi:MAG: hypothetical protein ACR2QO_20965 [Acidimicrobiales bacterium]
MVDDRISLVVVSSSLDEVVAAVDDVVGFAVLLVVACVVEVVGPAAVVVGLAGVVGVVDAEVDAAVLAEPPLAVVTTLPAVVDVTDEPNVVDDVDGAVGGSALEAGDAVSFVFVGVGFAATVAPVSALGSSSSRLEGAPETPPAPAGIVVPPPDPGARSDRPSNPDSAGAGAGLPLAPASTLFSPGESGSSIEPATSTAALASTASEPCLTRRAFEADPNNDRVHCFDEAGASGSSS